MSEPKFGDVYEHKEGYATGMIVSRCQSLPGYAMFWIKGWASSSDEGKYGTGRVVDWVVGLRDWKKLTDD